MEPIAVSTRTAMNLIAVKKTKLFQLLAGEELERLKHGRTTVVTVRSIKSYMAKKMGCDVREIVLAPCLTSFD